MSKPKIGQTVKATDKHPIIPQGEILGTVKEIDGAKCWVVDKHGDTDLFVWNFLDVENDYFEWSFEEGALECLD